MTTDVINGVPRACPFCGGKSHHTLGARQIRMLDAVKCLECFAEIEGTYEPYSALRKWNVRATAQPAADGEREVWAVPVLDGEKKTTFYTEQLPFVPGIGVKQLGEPVRMVEARAAQPQQAVAVTDEARRDAERYRYIRSEGIPDEAIAIVDSYYGELELVSPKRLDAAIDAALSTHKTGEEE